MKAVTVAAAGAALISSVLANAHGHQAHERLHARSEWKEWSNETTVSVPAEATTVASSVTDLWGEWSTPAVESSTSVEATSAPSSSELWSEWSTPAVESSTTPVAATSAPTSTGSSSSAPAESSSTPVEATSVASSTGTWGEWSSAPAESSTTPVAASTVPTSAGSTPVAESTTPVAATSAASSTGTWAEWSSAASSVTVVDSSVSSAEVVTETEVSGTWSSTFTTTIHTTWTSTVYLSPLPSSSTAESLSSVAASSSGTPVVATSTSSYFISSGWFGAPFPTSETLCVQQLLTSYGPPTWYPTPESSQPPSTAWSVWSSSSSSVATSVPVSSSSIPVSSARSPSSSTPVVETSVPATTPASSSSTLVVETSYTAPSASSTPVVETSTAPSASSTPVVQTSTAPSASSTPVVQTSTAPSASSTPVVETSTASSSWAEWTSSSPSSSESWAEWSTSSAAVYSSSAASSAPASSGTATSVESWSSSSASSTASSATSSSSSSSSSGSGSLTSNGNYFGMTFSPYTSSGGCKDASTVASDIAKIAQKGFASVRVYSTDCSTLENVGSAAKDNNLKLILGVYISSTGVSGAQQQVTDIVNWAQWSLVELIVVGNEAVFNGYTTASELTSFITSAKSSFQSAGYTGFISTTEPLNIWEEDGSQWCDVVDVVAANLYAFFNSDTSADQAASLIQSQIGILEGICSNKEVYVMESGWPTAGECNGAACPSVANQETALKGILNTSGSRIVFFSFEDDEWKSPGQYDVEQHWGCISVF